MIPATGHFIWFGSQFPYAYILAIRSALIRGGFDSVILHHADDIEPSEAFERLHSFSNFRCQRIHSGELADLPIAEPNNLIELFERLTAPAARANVYRAAMLAKMGGVYLDTDTITLKPFDALRAQHAAFCGLEHIALPVWVTESKNPLLWAKTGLRFAFRDLCRRHPNGWRAFQRGAHRFPRAANNAVVGATAGNAFLIDLLNAMVDTPRDRQLIRFALGTRLLQRQILATPENMECLAPEVFYPLGPEVSQHWFRTGSAPDTEHMVDPKTVCLHWYASVRTRTIVPKLEPDFIRRNADQLAFCKLAQPFVELPNS